MKHLLLIAPTSSAVLVFAACSSELPSDAEENKVIVRRAHDEVWSQGNLSAIDDLLGGGLRRTSTAYGADYQDSRVWVLQDRGWQDC
jgi:hypothetical protein